MNKRQARIEALRSCAALIDVNANAGDEGDLWAWVEPDETPAADLDRFRDACNVIADALRAQAARLARGEA